MIKRIFLAGLLTALTFVAVPINSASADHVSEPCFDPAAQAIGPVQTGSLDGNSDYDIWTDPGGGAVATGSYQWVINADAPIKVTNYIQRGTSCSKFSGTECVETHAPYTCHRHSFSHDREFVVIENAPRTGNSGNLNYQLVYVGADPL